MNRLYAPVLRLTFVAVVLAACSTAPPPTPSPSPADLLARAVSDLQSLSSVKFTLTRTGEPVVIETLTGATFVEGTGEYQAPDKVHARIKTQIGSAVLALDMLWLPEGAYMTNPITGGYMKVPASMEFDVLALFRADGLAGVLESSMSNVTLVGKESIEGIDAYHVRGEAQGDRLKALTAGTLVEGTHTVDVWIEIGAWHILRLRDTEPGGAANAWTLDLSGFNKPVEIKGP